MMDRRAENTLAELEIPWERYLKLTVALTEANRVSTLVTISAFLVYLTCFWISLISI